jgi:cell division protein ZapE
MLMDMFFASVPLAKKRRMHFQEFMSSVHEMIAEARQTTDDDPILRVGKQIAQEATLLCFDELYVTDIADAMILGRLFNVLFERGAVIVSTSNTPPAGLYRNGLNRGLFLPFIELIEDKMEVVQLEAKQDYRLGRLRGAPLYFFPLGSEAEEAIQAVWERLTGHKSGAPDSITVKERLVKVPQTSMGAARFTFDDLCGHPLGANDYLALTRRYHTIFLENVPVIAPEQRNEAQRFRTLIDTLYDHRTGLVMSAEAEPDALYPEGDGSELFWRTVSRLTEMRSESYLGTRHRFPK